MYRRPLLLILALLLLGVLCLTACSRDDSENGEETGQVTAPNFAVYDMDGKKVTLHESFGKPLVVNFWATWCPPCKAEMPYFDELYAEYKDRVDFMMINLTDGTRDTPEVVEAFIKDTGYKFPVFCDSDTYAAYAYSVQSIPTTIFYDSEGNILDKHVGMISEEALSEMLRKMTEDK